MQDSYQMQRHNRVPKTTERIGLSSSLPSGDKSMKKRIKKVYEKPIHNFHTIYDFGIGTA